MNNPPLFSSNYSQTNTEETPLSYVQTQACCGNSSYNTYNNERNNQKINLENIALGLDTRTTIMIRNIPIKYDDRILEKELEEFNGKYDCLYMPYDFKNNGNKGYAFLNMKNPFHLLLFCQKFEEKSWEYFASKKMCSLNYAKFQGIDEIAKHASNYKGIKKPVFYQDNVKEEIEVPLMYFEKMRNKWNKMKFKINDEKGVFIIDSFN